MQYATLVFFLSFFLAIVYNCICIDVFVDLLLMLIKSSNAKSQVGIVLLPALCVKSKLKNLLSLVFDQWKSQNGGEVVIPSWDAL